MRLPRLPLLDGPTPRLPRAVDILAERWAGLRPRVRLLVAVSLIVAVAAGTHARIQAAEQRWGGPLVTVLVADEPLPAGAAPDPLRRLRLPPAAVPADAVGEVAAGRVLAAPLPAGAVLTAGHLDVRGPAATLPDDLRAVPVPVEEGWGVVGGGWVDVWVLGTDGHPAVLVASSRPVLEVRDAASALIGLHVDEVAAATAGLAPGRLLLTHAPPPGAGREDS